MLLSFALATAASHWSTDLTDLDPTFRARVARVVGTLEAAGFTPNVGTTWRSPELQDLLALGPATQAKGGQSCHNQEVAGVRASRAIDLWGAPLDLALMFGATDRMAAEVPFLRALGAAAKKEGLRWGGDWHGHASAWDTWGLGWDPAHIEVRGCATPRAD
jgi:hypothetical protein